MMSCFMFVFIRFNDNYQLEVNLGRAVESFNIAPSTKI